MTFLSQLLYCVLAMQQPCQETVGIKPGAPIIRNFSPSEYRASRQNWGITQDAAGLMYFGNNRGVLIFDGGNWRQVELANNSIARGMVAAPDGRVYVGGTNEFGYLAVAPPGKPVYHSLSEELGPQVARLGNVSSVAAVSHGVYFRGKHLIARYHQEQIQWFSADTRGSVLVSGDRIFYAMPGKGIGLMDASGLRLLPHSSDLVRDGTPVLLDLDENRLLMITAAGLLAHYDLGRPEQGRGVVFPESDASAPIHYRSSEATQFLVENSINGGVVLTDGNFALSTRHGGAVVIDRQGRVLQVIDQKAGLRHDSIHHIYQDHRNNLWLTLNNGLAMVEASPFAHFSAAGGLDGNVLCHQGFEGRVYTGTFSGLYLLKDSRYALIEGSDHGVWDMLEYKGRLLALGDRLVEVRGDQTLEIPVNLEARDTVFYCLGKTPVFPDYVFLGSRKGLYALRLVAGDARLEVAGFQPVGPVPHRVRAIIPDSGGNLWLSSSYNGISYLRFHGPNPTDSRNFHYNVQHGLPDLSRNHVNWINNALLVETRFGPYSLTGDGVENYRFHPHPIFYRSDKRLYAFEPHPDGSIWALSEDGLGSFRPVGHGYRWQEGPARALEGLGLFIINDKIWVETNDELIRFDNSDCIEEQPAFTTRLRRIALGDRELVYGGYGPKPSGTLELARKKMRGSAISFEYTAAFFQQPRALQFQYMLEGYDDHWSGWSSRQRTLYTNLPGGSYRFLVRARNAYNQLGEPASFSFFIPQPWYSTGLWLFVFLFLITGLLALGMVFYVRKLNKRHEHKLEKAREIQEAQKFEALGRLAGGVAHDFNRILATIYGFSSLIREETRANGTMVMALEEIDKANLRGQGLVERILTFARHNNSRTQILNAYEEVVCALNLAQISTPPGIVVDLDMDPDCGWLEGDDTAIHQVVINLFQNAVQAVDDQGRIEVGLCAAGRADRDMIRLWVRDNGRGMDGHTRAHIFEPFFTTRGRDGTGLGLAVVHGIVEGMGGFVEVSSFPGCGSLFEVFFDRATPPCKVKPLAINQNSKGKQILWIDEEKSRLYRGVVLLRRLGYNATGAQYDEHPLEELKPKARNRHKRDLVILGWADVAITLREQIAVLSPETPVFLCAPMECMNPERACAMGFRGLIDADLQTDAMDEVCRVLAEQELERCSG